MSQIGRSFSLVMVLTIALASLFAASPPIRVYAAGNTYVVDNTTDNAGSSPTLCQDAVANDCSLRQALTLASSDNITSTITFEGLKTGDPNYASPFWTITPLSPLPDLDSGNTTINGRPTNLGTPAVIINGQNVPATSAYGLRITSAGNTVYLLTIINLQGNGTNGVGILITSPSATNNVIIGNYIGIRPGNAAPQSNSGAGIQIDDRASANRIGGTSVSERNVISGNSGNGLLIDRASNNTITGNYIGVTLNAISNVVAAGNNGFGVRITSSSAGSPASGNIIGGTSLSQRNVISANTQSGVLLTGPGTSGNTIAGNLIGTNDDGSLDLGNGSDGITIADRSKDNTISGTPIVPTVISGNSGNGVRITDGGTTGNRIFGGLIGLKDSGIERLANDRHGVQVDNDATSNQIGIAGQGNIISGNTLYGVWLGRTTSGYTSILSNTITANTIGLNEAGTSALGNLLGGVFVDDFVQGTRIGGATTGEQNVIAGNGGPGVVVNGTSNLDTVVSGNVIGLRRAVAGGAVTIAGGNNGPGIVLQGGPRRIRIGGPSESAGNIIGTNNGDGIQAANVISLTIQSNLIGLAKSGKTSLDLGNAGNGIRMTSGQTSTLALNQLLYNDANGLWMTASQTSTLNANVLNLNGQNGIRVDGGSRYALITASTIMTNTANGVLISDVGTQRVRVTDNRISANGLRGIELDPQTDGAPGNMANPNHDIDPPFGIKITQDGLLTGRVLANKTQASACLTCTIQIFRVSPELLDGEGLAKIDAPVEISANGFFTATVGSVPAQLALTATDYRDNTSEFAVFTATASLDIGPPRSGTAAPGDTITYSHRITNTGTVGFTDLQLSATSSQTWTTALAPANPITLAPGQSRPVTLTLTLPTGSDARVRAGTVDQTRVTVQSTAIPTATASVTDTTTVVSAFRISITPGSSSSSGLPGEEVSYGHTIRNIGNLTGTVALAVDTDVGWTTTLTPTTFTIPPGEGRTAIIGVTVPEGALQGTQAKTTLEVRITDPAGQATQYITDTTTVALERDATMVPDREGDAAAGETISFQHTVTNLSNGTAKFKLSAGPSSLGSTVTFRSSTAGVKLNPDNTFTLNEGAVFNFIADITVDIRAQEGDVDQILITLLGENGDVLDSVRDTINIRANALLPRSYLPMVVR